jgi:hypothetical protein
MEGNDGGKWREMMEGNGGKGSTDSKRRELKVPFFPSNIHCMQSSNNLG